MRRFFSESFIQIIFIGFNFEIKTLALKKFCSIHPWASHLILTTKLHPKTAERKLQQGIFEAFEKSVYHRPILAVLGSNFNLVSFGGPFGDRS